MIEFIQKFNKAIDEKNYNDIYIVASKICRIYFYKYKKEYNFNNIDVEEIISDVTVKLFDVMREKPNKENKYYFGVIKQETRWLILKCFKHNSNELLLSDLLDVEEHKYPESMMKSVSELANSSPAYLGERKVCSILLEYADKFYTINETASLFNVNSTVIYRLSKKYNIVFINGVLKKEKVLFEARKDDYYLWKNNKVTAIQISKKWNIGEACTTYWLRKTKEKEDYINDLKCWHYVFNDFPVSSLQDLVLVSTYNYVYIPKENYDEAKEDIKRKQKLLVLKEYGDKYEKDILMLKQRYLNALDNYNSLRKEAGCEEVCL